jgi:hypothetical protein
MVNRTLKHLLTATLLLTGCSRSSSEATVQADPQAEVAPPGTTRLPRLGGHKTAAYRCTIDTVTGKAEVDLPKDLEKDEEAAWNDLSEQISRDGHTFQVVMADNKKERKGGIPGFPDRVRVSISEVDARTKKLLRSIPVQEFQGEHERHGPRALLLKEGKIRFWMQFWVND